MWTNNYLSLRHKSKLTKSVRIAGGLCFNFVSPANLNLLLADIQGPWEHGLTPTPLPFPGHIIVIC